MMKNQKGSPGFLKSLEEERKKLPNKTNIRKAEMPQRYWNKRPSLCNRPKNKKENKVPKTICTKNDFLERMFANIFINFA